MIIEAVKSKQGESEMNDLKNRLATTHINNLHQTGVFDAFASSASYACSAGK
jgi:hypothetical protein